MPPIPIEVIISLAGSWGVPGVAVWYFMNKIKDSEAKRDAERKEAADALKFSYEERLKESRESAIALSAAAKSIDTFASVLSKLQTERTS